MLPLIVLLGPTGSGKTALSLALARHFGGEVLSCDSVAVYRGMELGTAKPSREQRAAVPHHLLDLYDPDQACTAGDYARAGRAVLASLAARGTLPIVAGGTGLYLRALLDGLFAAPPRNDALRGLLRERAARRGAGSLHRTLTRLDVQAAAAIHPNDVSKVVRAIEISVAARRPMTAQWEAGREALEGYRVLRLGYLQAGAVLDRAMTLSEAIAAAQQGHRNYAKRQVTWFRREGELHEVAWLRGTGDSPEIVKEAVREVGRHLHPTSNDQTV